VRDARSSQPVRDSFVVHRPEAEGIRIERADDASWIVLGRPAARAVALNDISNADALAYVQDRLKRLGVDKALAKAGAADGDVVRIGTFSFDYQDD